MKALLIIATSINGFFFFIQLLDKCFLNVHWNHVAIFVYETPFVIVFLLGFYSFDFLINNQRLHTRLKPILPWLFVVENWLTLIKDLVRFQSSFWKLLVFFWLQAPLEILFWCTKELRVKINIIDAFRIEICMDELWIIL